METEWFNSMRFNREYRCSLSQSIESLGPIENNGENEDPSIFTDMDNNIQSSTNNSENSSYSHDDFLIDDNNIQSCLSEKTLFVSDSDGNSYSIFLDIQKQILEIEVETEFMNFRSKRMKDSMDKEIEDSMDKEIEDSIDEEEIEDSIKKQMKKKQILDSFDKGEIEYCIDDEEILDYFENKILVSFEYYIKDSIKKQMKDPFENYIEDCLAKDLKDCFDEDLKDCFDEGVQDSIERDRDIQDYSLGSFIQDCIHKGIMDEPDENNLIKLMDFYENSMQKMKDSFDKDLEDSIDEEEIEDSIDNDNYVQDLRKKQMKESFENYIQDYILDYIQDPSERDIRDELFENSMKDYDDYIQDSSASERDIEDEQDSMDKEIQDEQDPRKKQIQYLINQMTDSFKYYIDGYIEKEIKDSKKKNLINRIDSHSYDYDYCRNVKDSIERKIQNSIKKEIQDYLRKTFQDLRKKPIQDQQDSIDKEIQDFRKKPIQDQQDSFENSIQDSIDKEIQDFRKKEIQNSIMKEIMEDSIQWYVRSQIGNDTTESDLTQIENSNDTTESDLTQFENYYYYYYDDTTESDLTQFENDDDTNESKFVPKERPFVPIDYSDPNCMEKLKHLWVQCESCDLLNYRKHCKSTMFICEHCGDHMKMGSSDRIELLIDPGTWNPMDEDMVFVAPIGFHSEDEPSTEDEPSEEYEASSEDKPSTEDKRYPKDEPSTEDEASTEDKPSTEDEPYEDVEPYEDYLNSYQDRTGLLDAVQTGTGKLDGVPVAIGIMDFNFIGGSMGCVVGEKITRLIEYATNQRLPLLIVCASGGARMQEGSLSLIQMAKISCALYNYQIKKKLFYIAILASPTTGGVTASFGMLGDIVITEPNAYIAFAGKRVIEELLKIEVPEGVQSAEFLFEKGAFDSLVPRPFLKEVLSDLLKFHGFFPLTENEN